LVNFASNRADGRPSRRQTRPIVYLVGSSMERSLPASRRAARAAQCPLAFRRLQQVLDLLRSNRWPAPIRCRSVRHSGDFRLGRLRGHRIARDQRRAMRSHDASAAS